MATLALSRHSSGAILDTATTQPSATDLGRFGGRDSPVRFETNGTLDNASGFSSSAAAQNRERPLYSSDDLAASRREASFSGQAAGSAGRIATPLPELLASASPQLDRVQASRQSSGTAPEVKPGSARSSDSSHAGSTWLSRVTARTEDLRSMFSLPESENVMDDFLCALQKKLLLQGRIYVFEHYVCFHSNVFGYVKNKVIPLKEVTAVRKKKNVGLPNSIEITWGAGRREFFTSFLSREDAFRLIMAAWHQSAPQKAAAQMFSAEAVRKGPRHAKSATAAEFVSALSAARAAPNEEANTLAASSAESGFLAKSANLLLRRRGGSERPLRNGCATEAGPAADFGRNSNEADAAAEFNGFQALPATRRASIVSTAERSNSWESTTGSEEGEQTPRDVADTDEEGSLAELDPAGDPWAATAKPPPPLAAGMQPLVSGEIRGITLAEFCRKFLADESPFFVEFHTARGDENAKLRPWRTHHPLGRVRELQFITPLKWKIGPSKTVCYQTQRYAIFAGDQLVFETSQVMPDIPYGDCFTVEARWNVHALPASAAGAEPVVAIQTHVMVDFNKSVFWRRTIESGVIASCRAAHEEWLAAAQRAVDQTSGHQSTPRPPAAAPSTPIPSPVVGSNGRNAPGSAAAIANLAARLSPASQAAVEQLLRGGDAAVGQLTRGPQPLTAPPSSVGSPPHTPARRRNSGGTLARQQQAATLSDPRTWLTKRQWVLLALAAAVIALQLIILWRFAAVAAGGGGSSSGAASPVVVASPAQPVAMAAQQLPPGTGCGTAESQDMEAGEAAAWQQRMQFLAADVEAMRKQLELLASDVSAAGSAAPQQGSLGASPSVAGCATGGQCSAMA